MRCRLSAELRVQVRRALTSLILYTLLSLTGCIKPNVSFEEPPDSGAAADSGLPNDKDVRDAESEAVPIRGEAAFEVEASLSPAIASVGIVTWRVNKGPLDAAAVDFGPPGTYKWRAQAETSLSGYRALLLGMKPSTLYQYRARATVGTETYVSDDYTIVTGPMPNGLPPLQVDTKADSERLAEGFTIACTFIGTANWVFVLDRDGDYVWWYQPEGDIQDWIRARMTYDGRGMLIANGNVPGPTNGVLLKVNMDGLVEETIDAPRRHHDVTLLPVDGIIAYLEYEETGRGTCDRIVERSIDGTAREVFMLRDHFPHLATDDEWCHSNAINYVPRDDAYYISVLNFNSILKVSRSSGELLWVLGGIRSDFPGVSWQGQHQHHVLEDSVLLFNNYGNGEDHGTDSRAIEYAIDESRLEASIIWEYSAAGLLSYAMGDVRRLPNGNTLITFSTNGTIHEVGPDGELLRSIRFDSNDSLGYTEWRPTLYGPPELNR